MRADASENGQAPQQAGKKVTKATRGLPLAEAGAVSSSPLALPFKRAWEYLTEYPVTIPPSLDSAHIYLPLEDGELLCLDRESGSLKWSDDFGGEIDLPAVTTENTLFIASKTLPSDGKNAGGVIRAIDKTTGLTLWVREYPRPFTSRIVLESGKLYAGSADGALHCLSSTDGVEVWRAQTSDVVRGCPLVTGDWAYFGGDDGTLRQVELTNGNEIWSCQTQGSIKSSPVLAGSVIYFCSSDGFVYSYNLAKKKLNWRSRTGAGIESSPIVYKGKLLIASEDNFIYALSLKSGNRIWKKRLSGRFAPDPSVDGDIIMAAPKYEGIVLMYLIEDGRRINYYQLDRGVEVTSGPIFTNPFLLVSTSRGLLAAKTAPPKKEVTAASSDESGTGKKAQKN